MATGDPLDVVELHFQYNLTGDPGPMFTALAVHVNTDFDASDARACLTGWGAAMQAFATDQYSIGPGFAEQWIEGEANRVVVGVDTVPGLLSADSSPQNLSYLVRKIGTSTGRAFQGRMYIPGVPEGLVTANGLLIAGTTEDIQLAIDSWFSSIMAGHNVTEPALVHAPVPEFIPGPKIANPAFPTERISTGVVALQVQLQCATQRRRMR